MDPFAREMNNNGEADIQKMAEASNAISSNSPNEEEKGNTKLVPDSLSFTSQFPQKKNSDLSPLRIDCST